MKSFLYHKPKNLARALDLLKRHGEKIALLAGGTDLLVDLKKRLRTPTHILDLKGLSSLEGIDAHPDGSLRISPLTTLSTIGRSPLLAKPWNILAQAASKVGSQQVRNRATIGGNICRASPSGDTLPALLCLEASVKLCGPGGARVLPLRDFFQGPGRSALQSDEILTEILLSSIPGGSVGIYKKLSLKRAVDLAVVGVAVLGIKGHAQGSFEEVRIALGAVSPTPIRAIGAEELLKGSKITEAAIHKAGQAAAQETQPISDLRGSEWYRRELIRHLTTQAIRELMAQA